MPPIYLAFFAMLFFSYAICPAASPDQMSHFRGHSARPQLSNLMDINEEIDAIGLLCPLPVLRLRKRLQNHVSGAVVRLLADDPAAVIDVAHFCNEQGHELLEQSKTAQGHAYMVRKG